MTDFLAIVPFAVVSSVVTWVAQGWAYRHRRKVEHIEKSDRLEIHRDEFTLQLLQNARSEITLVRGEINELREERSILLKLEEHVYHFQESLDHLERLLLAETSEDLAQAKRNAAAFLKRMRRLQDVKGTVLNEVQVRASEQSTGTSPAEAVTTITPTLTATPTTPEEEGNA